MAKNERTHSVSNKCRREKSDKHGRIGVDWAKSVVMWYCGKTAAIVLSVHEWTCPLCVLSVDAGTCHTSLNELVRCTSEAFFRWLCAIYRYKDKGTVADRAKSAPHPPVTTDWKCGNGWLCAEVYVVLWQNG